MDDRVTHDKEGRYTIPYPPPDDWARVVASDVYRRAVEQAAHIFTQKVRAFVDGWWDAKFEKGITNSHPAYRLGYDVYSEENDNPGALEEALRVAFGWEEETDET